MSWEREIAVNEGDAVAVFGLQFFQEGLGRAAGQAFKVQEFHHLGFLSSWRGDAVTVFPDQLSFCGWQHTFTGSGCGENGVRGDT